MAIPVRQNGPLPTGFYQGGSGAYVRDVQNPELASWQYQQLTNQNGQLRRQAGVTGANMANSRGLLNSSIASGNAQQAFINSAMPLAQADAAAQQAAAGQNEQYLNQMLMGDRQNATSTAVAGIGAGAQLGSAQISADSALQRQRENLAFTGEQAGIDRAFQDYMDQMGYTQDLGLQNNQIGGQALIQNLGFQGQQGLAAQGQGFNLQNLGVAQGYNLQNMGQAQNYNLQNLGVAQGYNLENLGVAQGYNAQNQYANYQYGLGAQNNAGQIAGAAAAQAQGYNTQNQYANYQYGLGSQNNAGQIAGAAAAQAQGYNAQNQYANYNYGLGTQNNATQNQGLLAAQSQGYNLQNMGQAYNYGIGTQNNSANNQGLLAQQAQGFNMQNLNANYQYGLGTQNNAANNAANAAAQAQGYNVQNLGLQNQYSQQQTTNQYQQALNNSLNVGLFNLGSSMLQGQQQNAYNMGTAAMNNPAIMSNPQAFGGYMQWLSEPFMNTTNNIFANLFPGFNTGGGGTP